VGINKTSKLTIFFNSKSTTGHISCEKVMLDNKNEFDMWADFREWFGEGRMGSESFFIRNEEEKWEMALRREYMERYLIEASSISV
jgi:hypothetical protein